MQKKILLGSELTYKKSRFTKHFKTFDENKYIAIINSASEHYEEAGEWKDIDIRLQPCSLTNWRWKIEKNNWTLLIGEGNREGAIAAVNKKDGVGFGWRPEHVAYLNIATKEWQILSTANYGTPDIISNKKREVDLKWSGVWPNVDVELKVRVDSVKQNILFSQTARDNAPAIPQGWLAKDTYLVWVYKTDWSKVPRMEKRNGEEINPDSTEIDTGVIFKNALGKFSQVMPSIGAWIEGHKEEVVPIRRRFIKYNGEHYLLEGCLVKKLNQLSVGTIVFDDNVTYTVAVDGNIYDMDANYLIAQGNAVGDLVQLDTNRCGQKFVLPNYTIYRLFLSFDTSGLDDAAIIGAGTQIQLCCEINQSTIDFDVCTLKGTQGDILGVGDYDAWDTETEGANRWNSINYNDENYINLTLNATGRGWINKTGKTYFCLRSLEDINISAPIGFELVQFRASNDAGKEPKLYIEYIFPPRKGRIISSRVIF